MRKEDCCVLLFFVYTIQKHLFAPAVYCWLREFIFGQHGKGVVCNRYIVVLRWVA